MKMTVLFLPVVLAGACHYDWGVGPREVADSGVESGGVEAAVQADGDAPVVDAAPGEPMGNQCDIYLAQVGLALPGILACKQTCAYTVVTECGCERAVEDPNSEAVKAYVAAVKQFKDAGCTNPNCDPCNAPSHTCFNLSGADLCY